MGVLPLSDIVSWYCAANSTSASVGRENLCCLKKTTMPLLTEAGGFHPRGSVDRISKQAIARHLDPHHTGSTGAWKEGRGGVIAH